MKIIIPLILISLFLLILSRRQSVDKTGELFLVLEILSTNSLAVSISGSFVYATSKFFEGQNFLLNWLIWLVSFGIIVAGIRISGSRIKNLSKKKSASGMADLVKNLEYHSSVFWKLITGIATLSLIFASQPLSTGMLLSLAYAVLLGISVQSAMKFYLI